MIYVKTYVVDIVISVSKLHLAFSEFFEGVQYMNISLVDLRKVINLMDQSMLFEINQKYCIPNPLKDAVKKLYDWFKVVVSFVVGVEVDGGV